jgi:hypothetical protein
MAFEPRQGHGFAAGHSWVQCTQDVLEQGQLRCVSYVMVMFVMVLYVMLCLP